MKRQALAPIQRDMVLITRFVVAEPGIAVEKEGKFAQRRFGVMIAVVITAHDDALFTIDRGQPVGIGCDAVRRRQPGWAISDEEVLSRHFAVVRLDAMPDAAVHDGHAAAPGLEDQLARERIARVVGVQVLIAVAARIHHQITHLVLRQISQPVTDLDLQGYLLQEDTSRAGRARHLDAICCCAFPAVCG